MYLNTEENKDKKMKNDRTEMQEKEYTSTLEQQAERKEEHRERHKEGQGGSMRYRTERVFTTP